MPQYGRWENVGPNNYQLINDGFLGSVSLSGDKFVWNIVDLSGRNGIMARGGGATYEIVKPIVEDAMRQILESGAYVAPATVVAPGTADNVTGEAQKEDTDMAVKKDKVKSVKGKLEDMSLRQLAGINKLMAGRLDSQLEGMPDEMRELCLDYVVNKDNGWDKINSLIIEEARKIAPNLVDSETTEPGKIFLDIFHSDKKKILWKSKEDFVNSEPKSDVAVHLGRLVDSDKNAVGSYGFTNIGPNLITEENSLVIMILGSGKTQNAESENVASMIEVQKNKIDVGIDLPLSIIAGRLKYNQMIRIIEFALNTHKESYDFKEALTKFLVVNREKQGKVYKDQMNQASNEITQHQTATATAVQKYVYAQNQLEVFNKMGDADRIFNNLDKVKEADYCKDLYYEKNCIVALFPDIRIKFADYEYKFGDFKVSLDISNGTVKANRVEGSVKFDYGQKNRTMDFTHPHVRLSGECCLGNYQKLISELIFNGDFASAISLMLEFLVNYNEANPFLKIREWKTDADITAESERETVRGTATPAAN